MYQECPASSSVSEEITMDGYTARIHSLRMHRMTQDVETPAMFAKTFKGRFDFNQTS